MGSAGHFSDRYLLQPGEGDLRKRANEFSSWVRRQSERRPLPIRPKVRKGVIKESEIQFDQNRTFQLKDWALEEQMEQETIQLDLKGEGRSPFEPLWEADLNEWPKLLLLVDTSRSLQGELYSNAPSPEARAQKIIAQATLQILQFYERKGQSTRLEWVSFDRKIKTLKSFGKIFGESQVEDWIQSLARENQGSYTHLENLFRWVGARRAELESTSGRVDGVLLLSDLLYTAGKNPESYLQQQMKGADFLVPCFEDIQSSKAQQKRARAQRYAALTGGEAFIVDAENGESDLLAKLLGVWARRLGR